MTIFEGIAFGSEIGLKIEPRIEHKVDAKLWNIAFLPTHPTQLLYHTIYMYVTIGFRSYIHPTSILHILHSYIHHVFS